MHTSKIKKNYSVRKKEITNRIKEFEKIWKRQDDREIFTELTFCLLTPQSKAKTCWDAVLRLLSQNILWRGKTEHIQKKISDVRFKNKKALYICLARDFFSEKGCIIIGDKLKSFSDRFELREWLVKNIKGMGYKEASHFLRNIGLGEGMAILDRHILKNLKLLKVIRDIPEHLSQKKYIEIENKMCRFSKNIKIPVHHLDLVLWSKETGEIFK